MRICRMEHPFNKSLKAVEFFRVEHSTLRLYFFIISRNAYHRIHLAKFQAISCDNFFEVLQLPDTPEDVQGFYTLHICPASIEVRQD